jgi:hypothetical protein
MKLFEQIFLFIMDYLIKVLHSPRLVFIFSRVNVCELERANKEIHLVFEVIDFIDCFEGFFFVDFSGHL